MNKEYYKKFAFLGEEFKKGFQKEWENEIEKMKQ